MNIAEFIENDLKHRIHAGELLPANLGLSDLAKHYGVSVTPVRKAVQALIAGGYLVRHANRSIELNPEKIGSVGDDVTPILPKTPADWDELLLHELMHASLNLSAVYLREKPLAEKYQVGRSIIRTTFNRFAGAGLLDHLPNHGWRVQPFRIGNLEAYIVVREVLEVKALELAAPNFRKTDIIALMDGEHHGLNNAVHKYIIEKSGNPYISAFFGQYTARYYTKLLYYAAPETAAVNEMTLQHLCILEAMRDERWETARQALSRHIRAQIDVLRKLLCRFSQDKKL